MALDRRFAGRFVEANEGFNRALMLNNEPLSTYYLGLISGMLAMVLPEHAAQRLITVKGMSADAINREIQPVLSRARQLLEEAERG